MDAYFSETKRGDVRTALEMWELSALGPAPVDLDPGQQSIRLDARRELAEALTEALSMAGDNLRMGAEKLRSLRHPGRRCQRHGRPG